MGSVRVHPDVQPVPLLRRNSAHPIVDKAVPELLLLDCAAEPAPRGRDVRRRHQGYNAGPSPGCLGQSQNWRLSLLLLLLLLLVLLLVLMLLVVRRGSPTRLDAGVAGIWQSTRR